MSRSGGSMVVSLFKEANGRETSCDGKESGVGDESNVRSPVFCCSLASLAGLPGLGAEMGPTLRPGGRGKMSAVS